MAAKIPLGKDELPLRWNKSVKDLPILQAATATDDVSDKPMSKAMFIRIHSSTLRNAGYFCSTSVHSIRRYLGKKVDGEFNELLFPGFNF